MPELVDIDSEKEPPVTEYPPEKGYVRWGMASSIGTHLLVITIVLILAYLNHIKSLRDLMTASLKPVPPPANEIEIIFPPDDTPPPPTDHPDWIHQILIKPPPPPPITPPKPKPKPPKPKTPEPIVHHAAPAPSNQAEHSLEVGSNGVAHPDYPPQARRMHMMGTVSVRVVFDGSGGVSSVEVIGSSGYSLLDNYTVHFIQENWHDPELSGKTESTPIVYRLTD